MWTNFTAVTINAGKCTKWGILDLLDEIKRRTGRLPDIIFGQEFGDRHDLKFLLKRQGYGLVESKAPGAGSTPVFYLLATMEEIDAPTWILILNNVWGGRGAGPSRLKDKGLNYVRLRHIPSGRRWRGSSWHAPASQQFARRLRVAMRAISLILGLKHLWRRISMLGMDANTKKGQYDDLVKAMTKAGWTNTDLASGTTLVTHGRNLYDQLWWLVSKFIKFVTHFTVAFGSDHLAKVGVWKLRMTKKAIRQQRRKS